MISVRPTVFADFAKIEIRKEQRMLIENGDISQYAKDVMIRCSSLTFETNDDILMIGAITELEPGRYYIFTLFSEKSGPYMLHLFRYARRLLVLYKGLTVEAHALWNDEKGNRFLRLLGFREVEILEKFHNGYTFIRYLKD